MIVVNVSIETWFWVLKQNVLFYIKNCVLEANGTHVPLSFTDDKLHIHFSLERTSGILSYVCDVDNRMLLFWWCFWSREMSIPMYIRMHACALFTNTFTVVVQFRILVKYTYSSKYIETTATIINKSEISNAETTRLLQ